MKRFFLLMITLQFAYFTMDAQVYGSLDVSNLSTTNSNPFKVDNGIYIAVGDSIMIATSSLANSFIPNVGEDTETDTLKGVGFWIKGYTVTNAANEVGSVTVYNKYHTYDYAMSNFGDAGTYNRSQESVALMSSEDDYLFAFDEGKTDTLVFVNNSNQDVFLRNSQSLNSYVYTTSSIPTILFNKIDLSNMGLGTETTVNPFSILEGVYLSPNDSVLVQVVSTLGSFTPEAAENTDYDTLSSISLTAKGYTVTNGGNEAATLTVYSKHVTSEITFSYFGDDLTYNKTQEEIVTLTDDDAFKFVEGEIDTLVFVNNSNQVAFVRLTQLSATSAEVISNIDEDLFKDQYISFTNPTTNGMLSVFSKNDFSMEIELIAMDGHIVSTKTLNNNDNSLDVSSLKAGLYLLRDKTTGSIQKVMIK